MRKIMALALCLALLAGMCAALAEEWVCPGCGKTSDGNFCPFCGAPRPTEVTCPDCGMAYDLALGYRFCPNCGASLAEEAAAADVGAGDIIAFGRYDQDGDDANGAEPIEWQVLESDGATATVISRYILDTRVYNTRFEKTSWETCTLRQWLNEDFLNAAFDATEQARLETVDVTADVNSDYPTRPGNDTRDRVYLLSMEEVRRYFATDEERVCLPTATAVAHGAWVDEKNGASWWWLRTPGDGWDHAVRVYSPGTILNRGYNVNADSCGVRPVVRLSLAGLSVAPRESEASAGAGHSVGETLTFGRYEQDGDASNGPEPIEWRVVETDGATVTLISARALDAIGLNQENTDVTWETCTLRQWLNDDFLNAAFTPEEQAALETAEVTPDENPEYLTDPGSATRDKVYLASYDEAERWFESDADRLCLPTEAAEAKGASTDNDSGGNWWWLRTPGVNGRHVCYVQGNGELGSTFGDWVFFNSYGVRPVVKLRPEGEEAAGEEAAESEALAPGDALTFGRFEQDGSGANGEEPIEWIVLENDGERVKLISRYGLEARRYGMIGGSVTWEGSMIRVWLNDTFLNAAFTPEEQAALETVTVPAEKNPRYDTDPGSDTEDRVYLLSVDEASRYFPTEEARGCEPTAAGTRGKIERDAATGNCWWWLRSPGANSEEAALVRSNGTFGSSTIGSFRGAARPVVTLRLSALRGEPEGAAAMDPETTDAAGDALTFGCYEQDGDADNGAEPIEWLVLETDGATATLISRQVLACAYYNAEKTAMTWENCDLRRWLNDEFLNAAFDPEELARLETVTVTADPNPNFEGDPGSDTQDLVFVPSVAEANRWFDSDEARCVEPTPAAAADGCRTQEDTGVCWWWLRTPGSEPERVSGVDFFGATQGSGSHVNARQGVRPVVVIRLAESASTTAVEDAPQEAKSADSFTSRMNVEESDGADEAREKNAALGEDTADD